MQAESEEGTKVPQEARKEKVIKAPKRSVNSFIMFLMEAEAEVRQNSPGSKAPDVAKVLGARWGRMSDQDKEKYIEMAAKAKDEFLARYPSAGLKKEKVIVQARSAFNFFVSKNFSVVKEKVGGDAKFDQIIKHLAQEWANLTDAAKVEFVEKNQKDLEVYPPSTKTRRPKKRPPTGYNLFIASKIRQRGSQPAVSIMKVAGESAPSTAPIMLAQGPERRSEGGRGAMLPRL
jgi:hypothetical protein